MLLLCLSVRSSPQQSLHSLQLIRLTGQSERRLTYPVLDLQLTHKNMERVDDK